MNAGNVDAQIQDDRNFHNVDIEVIIDGPCRSDQ